MLAALGSPVRSQAPLHRHQQTRSAPSSPLPLSAYRAIANFSPSGSGTSTSTNSNSSNALPQAPDSPATPARAAPSPTRPFQPLRDGVFNAQQPLFPLPPLAEEQQEVDLELPIARDDDNGGLAPLPLLLGGPEDLLLALPFQGPIAAAAGGGDAGLGAAIEAFPPDPHRAAGAAELAPAAPAAVLAAAPPADQAQPQPPPPAAIVPRAAAVPQPLPLPNAPQLHHLQHLQHQVGGQIQQQWQQWQVLLQEVHVQMAHMQQQVAQAQALQAEMQEMHQEAAEQLQAGAQGVLQQAVQQAAEQLMAAAAAAAAAPAAPAAPAAAAAAPADAPAAAPAAPEVPLAAPSPRDPETDLEPGVWLLKEEVPAVDGSNVAAAPGGGDKVAGNVVEPKYSEPAMVFLRSLNSNKRTRVLFANESGRNVTAFWLNYGGQEVVYGALLPGQAKIYETYVSHPWVFRCSETGERLVVGGRMAHFGEEAPPVPPPELGLGLGLGLGRRTAPRPQPKRVAITAPPPLKHSRETHAAFPADFKAASRALLLAHQRLQRPDLQAAAEAAAAAAAAAAEARRTVAEVMCRMFRSAICSVILAAQPAMQAMGVVCGPSAGDSPGSETATCNIRWLDGAAIGNHDGDNADRVTSRREPGRMAVAWRNTSAQLAAGPAAAAAAAPAAASGTGSGPDTQIRAPGTVHMRANSQSPQQQQRQAAGEGAAGETSPSPTPSLRSAGVSAVAAPEPQSRRGAGASPYGKLPARSEERLKARAEAEAEAETRSAAQMGELLAELPRELVYHIIHLMAPPLTQHVALHPRGHPDILPALLPCDPATWAPRPAEQNA
ncbi:hypothetical protein PLESTB_001231900 [Pleodorina starrii]|uniref:von Hippel-Lindau disease tumour suppressor beta domain-containing protein n=1 Tax=Pleodorina starrii TaxID=330485 RepID=A0A9W6BSB9_9CHLO|nr:hypothetical protein PLESTM_000227700 [Pleodorina starrii]GLC57484.1 hypothetical protein PLESTB_001231900 [Pleodorina starrii]GLC63158.1 hypothetical protein PLESTF_000006100 [Pleodorina starrii]